MIGGRAHSSSMLSEMPEIWVKGFAEEEKNAQKILLETVFVN
jgi:hypothetical protein